MICDFVYIYLAPTHNTNQFTVLTAIKIFWTKCRWLKNLFVSIHWVLQLLKELCNNMSVEAIRCDGWAVLKVILYSCATFSCQHDIYITELLQLTDDTGTQCFKLNKRNACSSYIQIWSLSSFLKKDIV